MSGASSSRNGRSTRRPVSNRMTAGASGPSGISGAPSSGFFCCSKGSAPIVGVDVDVAVGEIAGPYPRLALADADVDGDGDVAALDVLGDRRLVVVRTPLPLLGDGHAADADAQAVSVGLLAGLADGHDDASPVGIAAGDRGLDQRRIGDGERDPPRRL